MTSKKDWRAWGKAARAMQTEPPRPKVLRPCPKCGREFGARELREHKPRCVGGQTIWADKDALGVYEDIQALLSPLQTETKGLKERKNERKRSR